MNKPKLIILILIIFALFLGYVIGKSGTPPANNQLNLPYEEITVSGVDNEKQKQIEDFVNTFYNHKQDKDPERLMSLFSAPATPEEQSDLDFILGKDDKTNDKPLSRLFSTQGYKHTTSGYFIRDIRLVGGDIKLSVDELRSFYSGGEYVGYTSTIAPLIIELTPTNHSWQIKNYYHKDTQGKYEGFKAY